MALAVRRLRPWSLFIVCLCWTSNGVKYIMKYELIAVLPLQTEEETQVVVSKLEGLLKEQGAMEVQGKSLNRGRLAYRVKKTNQGQHWLLGFELAPEGIMALKQAMKLMGGVLRFDVVKAGPKVVAVAKEAPAPAKGWTKREEVAPAVVTEEAPKISEAEKPTLEDLDKRLNAILEGGI